MAAIQVALPASSGAILTQASGSGPIIYMGYSVRETAGAAASFRVREASVTGTILESRALAPNESLGEWFGPQGKLCNSTVLYYEKVSGTIEGSVSVA